VEALRAWKEFQEASEEAERTQSHQDGMEATAAYERAEKALNEAVRALAPLDGGRG
jgi:hypothetical protein